MNLAKLCILFATCSWLPVAAQHELPCGTHWDSDWLHSSEYISDIQSSSILRNGLDEKQWLLVQCHSIGNDQGDEHIDYNTLLLSLCKANEDFSSSQIGLVFEPDVNRINDSEFQNLESTQEAISLMKAHKVSDRINIFLPQRAGNNAGYYIPSVDGIVVTNRYLGRHSTALTHEIGHFFKLPHTFFGWEEHNFFDYDTTPGFVNQNARRIRVELISGKNCTVAGDQVCDTRPDYFSFRWACDNNGLSEVVKDPEGNEFRISGRNYMSYAVDQCQKEFSALQIQLMQSVINSSRFRFIQASPDQDIQIEDPIHITYPLDGQEVRFDEVEIIWDSVLNATHYLVEIYHSSITSTSTKLAELISTENRVQLGREIELESGRKYFVRIKPFSPYQTCTEFSELLSFIAATTTDVHHIDKQNAVKVYPTILGSSHDNLYIQPDFLEIERINYRIINLGGLTVVEGSSNSKNDLISIDTKDLIPGFYIVSAQVRNHTINTKILVQ